MSDEVKISRGPGEMMGNAGPGMLAGIRVIEIADERAEYAGLLLAGLGAEVVKVEPPEGNATRRIGPFLEDQPGIERSLFFWNYNRNKKSVVLDLPDPRAREHLLGLLGGADVLLDASCGALNQALGLDRGEINARFPQLVTARMTPFGEDGPWADFKSSDLIHLALGGVMMNCGYDPDPNLEYDTPPIAPQIWHAYHIAGEQLATGIIAALIHRERSGEGQDVSVADPRGSLKEPRAGHHVLGHAAGAAMAADQPPCRRISQPLAGHLSHQGRALVHHPRHGRARPEEPGAAAVEIRR